MLLLLLLLPLPRKNLYSDSSVRRDEGEPD